MQPTIIFCFSFWKCNLFPSSFPSGLIAKSFWFSFNAMHDGSVVGCLVHTHSQSPIVFLCVSSLCDVSPRRKRTRLKPQDEDWLTSKGKYQLCFLCASQHTAWTVPVLFSRACIDFSSPVDTTTYAPNYTPRPGPHGTGHVDQFDRGACVCHSLSLITT